MAALSYLGRKMGVPALGLQLAASTPRPRCLNSNCSQLSYQVQGGHNNEASRVAADAWKPLPHDDVDPARQHAEFIAACEDLRKAFQEERRNRRFLVRAICTGVGMAFLSMWYTAYTEMKRAEYWRSKLLEL